MSKNLAIFGFGNQAKAWAMNLRDSGYQISILLRPDSPNLAKAEQCQFNVVTDKKFFKNFSKIALLTPDHTHLDILNDLANSLASETQIIYAHGFSCHEHKLPKKFPQFSHLLLAPKTIASELRFHYQTKDAVAGVMSVDGSLTPEQDKVFLKELAYDLGFTIPPYLVSYSEETTADLFSEQALLCGLYPFVINLAYNELVKTGHSEPLSFLECWHESKLIMNALISSGPEKFFSMISPNALLGANKAQKILLDDDFKNKLKKLLAEIQNGNFSHQLQESDFKDEKAEILNFWNEQKLTKKFNEMKNLYEAKHDH